MSQVRPPDLSEAGITAIPDDVLRNSWNTGHRLVSLAIENPEARPEYPGARVTIFPDILLDPNGIVGHCVTYPDDNVFGDKHQDLVEGNAIKATAYSNRAIGFAFHLAQQPLRALAKAKFECEYIRHLTKFGNHIVLEADWNM